MSISNDTSAVSGAPAQASTPTPKKKAIRKKMPSAKMPKSASARRTSPRTLGPIEILFTQEPNPLREPVPPFIWIDYPTQQEVLKAPTYCIRLGVGGADLVEISIDKSPWIPCRLTSGYWWYDWATIPLGKHTLVARMRTPDGRWFKTPPRVCDYRSE